MIITKEFKSIIVLTFLTVALFASGCTEKNMNAEDIATQMLDKQNSTQDYSYTAHIISHFEGKTEESETKTMFKKPNLIKSIVTEPGKENQTVVVSDGEFLWSYIPDTNTVTKMKLPEVSEPNKADYINAISNYLNDTNVTLHGVESVDGRSAYVLEATPKETDGDYELIYKTKIWVDQETWMPLRYEIYNSDGNLTIATEIRDLKLNTGIPDSEFKFEVPEGAKIKDLGEIKLPEKLSLEEARKKVSFKILTPQYLPEGYTFNYSMAYNNSEYSSDQIFETVELTYTKEQDSISLAETVYENQSSNDAFMDKGEDIKINGMKGKYISMGKTKLLTWKLGNVNLSLCASLEKDELLKIAESISEKA
jgi:outer membrane lipoprotein-sorting protein